MDRLGEWQEFNAEVLKHIVQYAIPQYQNEDETHDQVGALTLGDCITSIQRYINRFGRNARGNKEALRDLLKIAHYACIAYFKLRRQLCEPGPYEAHTLEAGREG